MEIWGHHLQSIPHQLDGILIHGIFECSKLWLISGVSHAALKVTYPLANNVITYINKMLHMQIPIFCVETISKFYMFKNVKLQIFFFRCHDFCHMILCNVFVTTS